MMRIGSVKRYRMNRVHARALPAYHFQEALGHLSGNIVGAEAWALGESGEPLTERAFEVFFSETEHEAIICSGNKGVATAAESLEDAIERFLGINKKFISAEVNDPVAGATNG
ncbi:MAG TPA: hypothetical protein VEK08_03795 [Planctomycetota bacterium]|nr:hypothetical protein [Planctomycetota bacterium]